MKRPRRPSQETTEDCCLLRSELVYNVSVSYIRSTSNVSCSILFPSPPKLMPLYKMLSFLFSPWSHCCLAHIGKLQLRSGE